MPPLSSVGWIAMMESSFAYGQARQLSSLVAVRPRSGVLPNASLNGGHQFTGHPTLSATFLV